MSSENRGKGRPTNYTIELADRICHLVATHTMGYDPLCKMYPDIPTAGVVREWRLKFPDFGAKYLQAKAAQAELMVEDIDDMLPDGVKIYIDDKGNERIDAPSASMIIAKINNRKWMAARLAPRRYGDYKDDNSEDKKKVLKEEMMAILGELDEKNKKEY